MRRKRGWVLLLFGVGLLAPALAQDATAQVEVGFQINDVDGNQNTYDSQINRHDGMLLRSLQYATSQTGEDGVKWFDRLRLDANGFGALPHGRFRLQANKAQRYNLKLTYSRAEHFNALLESETLNPGEELMLVAPQLRQHRVDRVRQWGELELEILPEAKLRPVIGLAFNDYEGPASTTYHLGQDEFRLDSELDERETELRAGLQYRDSWIDAELIQTWRNFEGDESRTAQAGDGANGGPILGEDIFLDNFSENTRFDSDTSLTQVVVRVLPNKRFSLLATYVDTDPESELEGETIFSGNFASFRINRFFGSAVESLRSRTDSPSWRGDLRLEWDIGSGFEIAGGLTRRNLKLDGHALIDTLFINSVTFTDGNPTDYRDVIDAETRMERDEELTEIQITSTTVDHFTFWGGFSRSSQEIAVDQSLAQIVVPQGQEGLFERDIDHLSLGARFRKGRHRVSLEFRRDEADQTVVRTDFLDRDLVSLRIKTMGWKNKLTFSGKARWVDGENPADFIHYGMDLFHAGVDVTVRPVKKIFLNLSYGIFDLESEVNYRDPLFQPAISFHREDGTDLGANLHCEFGKLTLKGGYGLYDSDGALAFQLEKTHLNLNWPLTKAFHAIVEAGRHNYEEPSQPLADYDSDTYSLLIRWQK